MKFSKLSKEKQIHLVLALIGIAAVLCGLGFGLIRYQYGNLKQIALKTEAAKNHDQQMEEAVKRADKVRAELDAAAKTLAEKESHMATGDLFSWMINTMKEFKTSYKVEIPGYGQGVTDRSDLKLLPKFPFEQVALSLNGTAYFHDLGRFLADFENEFPYMRIVNLDVEPASSAGPGEMEKLAFRVEVVALVKPDHI